MKKKPTKTPPSVKVLMFDPKPDITAYELAKYCLPLYLGRVPMNPETWNNLGPCQRHFTERTVKSSTVHPMPPAMPNPQAPVNGG